MSMIDGFADPAPKFDRKAYNASPRGKEVRKKYRHDKSKYVTDTKYLSRKIVAIDGEGINLPDGSHSYVMLAITGAKPLINKDGLHTEQVLRYIHNHMSTEDINVIYGGSYDFNMWLHGIPEIALERLYKSNFLSGGIELYGYTVKWMKGKQFTISKGGRNVIINDVVSFFQSSFIAACDTYLQDSQTWIDNREIIVREKAKRGDFTLDEIVGIGKYNQLELVLLVELVTELRARLNRVNLRPRRWNSPGAIASALFTREKVKFHLPEGNDVPPEVARAARFAYAGGRFEMIKYGQVRTNCYEYDINSAYPMALSKLPSLSGAKWRHTIGDGGAAEFALYRVQFSGTRSDIPAPVFVRSATGTVAYPLEATNWIWSPEMEVLRKYCEQVEGATYTVLETWVCTPSSDIKPFKFIPDLYDFRQTLKALGDGAQIAIKLALNSIYGKTAQQVGWVAATDDKPLRTPPYHCLEWAGYVTSWTRARVLEAVLPHLDKVIAFETDAVFTTVPLDVLIGNGLGEWEETVFTSLSYVQSGHYYGTTIKKGVSKEVVKCRGIDKGFISREQIEQRMTLPEDERILDAELTRFYGAGIALARGIDAHWCRWMTEPKKLSLYPTGKRIHLNCDECDEDNGLTIGVWHSTVCPVFGGESHEFPVEWINPNADMTELSDARRSEVDYEYESA